MLSSDSIFLKAHDSLIMLITSQKHQACKIPVLIKQQTFAFLGILQIYLQNWACVYLFLKLKYLNLQKLCL